MTDLTELTAKFRSVAAQAMVDGASLPDAYHALVGLQVELLNTGARMSDLARDRRREKRPKVAPVAKVMADWSDNLTEASGLRALAAEWIASLRASGVSPRVIGPGVLTALAEMVLIDQGKPATVAWLRGQADLLDQVGDSLRLALQSSPGSSK